MGRDKALLPHPDGGRFIDHAIKQVSTVCDEVCVAGAIESQLEDINVVVLRDEVAFQGPITGIIAAMQYAKKNRCTACVVTPVDMPWLTSQEMSLLIQSWQKHRQLVCGVSDTGTRQPLVAIYPTQALPLLQSLAKSDDRSLTRWIENQAHQTVRLQGDACRNINRPGDL
jgi:molybdopterin-guanine dinucleotide biosynthesis protein A